MPISKRVPVPPELLNADSWTALRANAEKLAQLDTLDTPQALPPLADYHARLPGLPGLVLRAATLVVLGAAGMAVLAFGLLAALEGLRLAYAELFAGLEQLWPLSPAILGGLGFVAWLWPPTGVRADLLPAEFPLSPELPAGPRALLGMVRALTWVMALAALALRFAAVFLPALVALTALQWQASSTFSTELAWTVIALSAGLIGVGLLRGAPGEGLLIALALGGAAWLYLNADWQRASLLGALAVGFALFRSRRLTRLWTWPYRRWHQGQLAITQQWAARRALDRAFGQHSRRNRERVAGQGAEALCQTDYRRFVRRSAGPVTYWWCPECQDDTPAFTSVRRIEGLLDRRMSALHDQASNTLKLNLAPYLNGAAHLSWPQVLQEVIIGPTAGTHDVELFVARYQEQAARSGWPPLRSLHCRVLPEAEADEQLRRLIRSNFRS
jgi:hypothetical protein